jgi:CRISPR-associated endonuclease/helicase Cas3
LNDVFAKSRNKGGDTLAQHTWDVLARLASLRQLRPTLPDLAGAPRLWHCLFWAGLLHDFGKAARGFQAMLGSGERWRHRHEVLSLAFFDWIAPTLSIEERRWIVAAIVSHHRDANVIQEAYADVDPDPLVPLLAELDPAVVSKLWHWLDGCAADWIAALGFTENEVRPLALMPHDEAVALVEQRGVQRTRHWLRQYERWVDEMGYPLPAQQVVLPILLRGLTTSADHLASAHLARLADPVRESWEELAGRILQAHQEPYAHQRASAAHAGQSALLIAPTGSGKTEAALYWALGDGSTPVSRLFYALPYQASMNAMFERLTHPRRGFGAEAVGLQHGRAMQTLYARLVDQENDVRRAVNLAKLGQNINTLNARPVKVFSPYQMLKAAFQLRGFEATLTDYAQAAFIFDEIHAYEPDRLALILALVRYLRERFGARFFVMSATFPQLIREKLTAALSSDATIRADAAVFRQFQRHRLQLLDGELAVEGIDRIVDDVREGKQVLVCANTVRRAQEVRSCLRQAGLVEDQILLLHGRYITKHRTEREEHIAVRCGLEVPPEVRRPLALVATQVVEVSLNIDLDTIYSDPAPLEALLQRFGRVNRQGKKGICPVHVFRQPDDGQGVYGFHRDAQQRGRIVRLTLAELEKHDNTTIDESAVNTWLDDIYRDTQLRAEWEAEYGRVAQAAALMLANLRPFNSDDQREEEFERLFDNVEVLPERFEQEYLARLADDDYIEASRYFVGISRRQYAQLSRAGLVRPLADPDAKYRRWVVLSEYDDDAGLRFEPASRDPDWG